MRIEVAPTLRRLLIELALGRGTPDPRALEAPCPGLDREPDTIADRASDLLAATAALKYLQDTRATRGPRGRPALTDRDPGAGGRV